MQLPQSAGAKGHPCCSQPPAALATASHPDGGRGPDKALETLPSWFWTQNPRLSCQPWFPLPKRVSQLGAFLLMGAPVWLRCLAPRSRPHIHPAPPWLLLLAVGSRATVLSVHSPEPACVPRVLTLPCAAFSPSCFRALRTQHASYQPGHVSSRR